MNDNKKEKTDYFKLLETGFFWEFYPHLSGEWEKDKDEFIESHAVERLDPIELKRLETKILETIKTGE